jgi:hypothetical protein
MKFGWLLMESIYYVVASLVMLAVTGLLLETLRRRFGLQIFLIAIVAVAGAVALLVFYFLNNCASYPSRGHDVLHSVGCC